MDAELDTTTEEIKISRAQPWFYGMHLWVFPDGAIVESPEGHYESMLKFFDVPRVEFDSRHGYGAMTRHFGVFRVFVSSEHKLFINGAGLPTPTQRRVLHKISAATSSEQTTLVWILGDKEYVLHSLEDLDRIVNMSESQMDPQAQARLNLLQSFR